MSDESWYVAKTQDDGEIARLQAKVRWMETEHEKWCPHFHVKYLDMKEAANRFAGLMDAVHPSYDDSVIIRCEVTAGDIRALMAAVKEGKEK
jgi:hypothetical protein